MKYVYQTHREYNTAVIFTIFSFFNEQEHWWVWVFFMPLALSKATSVSNKAKML
jgi:hypothetical protein